MAADSYDIEQLAGTVRMRTGRELKVIYLEETGSTNVWAGEYVREHGDDISIETPVLVVADSQTAGKGRLGHVWMAQPGEGISMSLIVDPQMDIQQIPQITLTTGIAVRRALAQAAGVETYVKWPNDILVKCSEDAGGSRVCEENCSGGGTDGPTAHTAAAGNGYRKLCGILCAMSCGRVICGIGINVHTLHFPEEIAWKASSVDLCSGRFSSRTWIAAEAISELLVLLDTLRNEGWSVLKDEYDRCCVNREGRILLTDHLNPKGKKTGTAYGTDDEGRLRVKWDDGRVEQLDAGEIELI